MKICVDTVVLIDILKDEFQSNQEKLYSAIAAKETLMAPVVVFAELMPQFNGVPKTVGLKTATNFKTALQSVGRHG